MAMGSTEMSTLAALAGSALGGITPIISNTFVQRSLTRREILSKELLERQNLYAEFIRFAANTYVQAMTSKLEKADDLVLLYALVGRIRLLASSAVIEAAEHIARIVTQRYGEENLSLEALRTATLESHIDPLNEFSDRCRSELRQLQRYGISE